MPFAPPRACRICGRARCTKHVAKPWAPRAPVARVRGRELQRRRQALFARQPFCAECTKEGRRFPNASVIRDHVIPLAEGGIDDDTNEQGLCQEHSDQKSAAEAKRGRQR